ncbi:MAG TPA: hypothetical protein VNF07_06655 [Acidimicrobiales bacterium]|nr:hypothetical protein [Acidimicrobiales bacterium]
MGAGLTDRTVVEQRLFDVHARLERARNELALAEERALLAGAAAEEARNRMAVSETPLAHREWCEARRRRTQLLDHAAAAGALVSELEESRDELLGKLVG